VCPVTGSTTGSSLVSGDLYIEKSFNYHYDHIWRNYGILIAYFVFFLVLYGLAVEFVPQVVKGKGDVLIYLQRQRRKAEKHSKTAVIQDLNTNVREKAAVMPGEGPEKSVNFGNLERSHDCFTWNKIEYEIPVKGGTKTLLTGIHGYVKPGTMTGKSDLRAFILLC